MVIRQSGEMVFINVETAVGKYICKRWEVALSFQLGSILSRVRFLAGAHLLHHPYCSTSVHLTQANLAFLSFCDNRAHFLIRGLLEHICTLKSSFFFFLSLSSVCLLFDFHIPIYSIICSIMPVLGQNTVIENNGPW